MRPGSFALTPAVIVLFAIVAFLAVLNFAIIKPESAGRNNSNAAANTNITTNVNTAILNTNADRTLVTNSNPTNTNQGTESTSNEFSYTTVRAGDRLATMVVEKVGKFTDDPQYSGISPNHQVTFSGRVTITGRVQSQFSEFGGQNQVCVHDLTQDSLALIPKAKEDTRVVWFCLVNTDQALPVIPIGTNDTKTIVIENYIISDYPSEVFNQATFVSLSGSTVGWKTFSNETWGISFKYPADWVVRENTLTGTIKEPGGYVNIGPPNSPEIRSYKQGMIVEANGLGRGGPPSQRFYSLQRQPDGAVEKTNSTETCESFGNNICDGTYGFLIAAQLPTGDERNGFFLQFPSASNSIQDPAWIEIVENIIRSLRI